MNNYGDHRNFILNTLYASLGIPRTLIENRKKEKNKMNNKIQTIQAINAEDIPPELEDVCLDIDDEFPLHYSKGIVRIQDDGNLFSEWLKEQGYIFPDDKKWANGVTWGWLGVWGT